MPNDLQLLQKGIASYVDDAIRTAPYTEIVTGVISGDYTIFSKGYTVTINGKQYSNVPRQGDTKYGNGTTVKIAIPNGQYNNMFIMGRVKMGDEGQQFGTVNSVNGMTGEVVLDKGDLGLANVDNTSDLNKPISTATQTALNAKADKGTFDNNSALTGGTVYSNVQVTDGMVTGLATKTLTTAEIEPTTTRRYVPEIPAIDASNKFLNGDGSFTNISIGGATSSGNMYFSNVASNIATYLKLSYSSDASETTKTITVNNSADVLGNVYLYDSPIGVNAIDAGIWKSTFNTKVSNAVGTTRLKIVVFTRETTGIETDLFTKYTDEINSTDFANIYTETNRAQIPVSPTARLGFRIYGTTTSAPNVIISYNIGGTNGSYINSPLALRHSQLRDKDGESAYQHITSTVKTDLTDGGDTTLHYHATDRNRANHTGTQTSSTISDFASTVRSTVLTGLSTATNAIISATDTVLLALGKLQAQITANLSTLTTHIGRTDNPHSVTKTQVGLGNVDNTSDATKNVLSATKLTTARTLSLTGDVVGSVSTDFSSNQSITTVVSDNSHNHNEMVRIDITGQTLDINTLTLSDGSKSKFYVVRTDGGASGITNIPVSGYPFILNVESVRYWTSTDYTTIQTFMALSLGNPSNDGVIYKRHCISGTWGNWYEEYSSLHKQPDVAKLTTPRTISLTGDVTASGSFDGSANLALTTTVADNSHNHSTSTISNLKAGGINQDANTIGVSGFYHCGSNVPVYNGESDKAVIHTEYSIGSVWATQIAISWRYNKMWFRSKANGTWIAWAEVANIASPALTGIPTAPTAVAGTNTTQIATTAFVKTAIDAMPTITSIQWNE